MTNLQAEGTVDVKYFIPRTWPEVGERLEDFTSWEDLPSPSVLTATIKLTKK